MIAAAAVWLTCCGKTASDKPPTKKAKPVVVAAPSSPPAEEVEPPLSLPAGQTPGDLLPALPNPAPRLATGAEKPAALYPNAGCADLGPQGFALVKRLEVTLPAKAAGELPGVLEACLFQQSVERKDRFSHAGRQFQLVAAWPGEAVQTLAVDEAARPPATLPPERQKAGHDAAAWGTLIATGWPQAPILAVLSARFYDGELGEQLAWQRDARWLKAGEGWLPLEKRGFVSLDQEHLRSLCEGRADASPADKAAGALQLACDFSERLGTAQDNQAAERVVVRARRLKGQGEEKVTPTEADPQSIWLREARRALQKGAWQSALQLALRVDTACGEPVTEAHALIAEALQAGRVAPAKVQPAQATVDLCEPLPDKAAPRRKAEVIKPAAKAGERTP